MLWSPLCVIYLILPFFIAWFAEHTGIKQFYKEYLSLKDTKWKSAFLYLIITAALFAVVSTLIGFATGGIPYTFAKYDVLNLFSINVDSAPTYILAILINIVALLIVGSVIGIFNSFFEETAWRGFLAKHLNVSRLTKGLIIGFIWTAWMIPIRMSFETDSILLLALQNIILSYYLDAVADDTKSVWTGAMIRGMFSLNCVIPLVNSSLISVTISIAITVLLIWVIRCKKTTNLPELQ